MQPARKIVGHQHNADVASLLSRPPADSDHFAYFSPANRWIKSDLLVAVVISIAAFAIHWLGAVGLEYFRHTEADRTLIGWEMYRRGEFLVPRLLDSVILTKPPLFYWLIALAVAAAGEVSESVARMPSLFAAAMLTGIHYTFWRYIGGSRALSLLAAAVFSASPMFFREASVAEIDMIFAFFSTISFYCAFLGLQRCSYPWMVGAYVAAALAFLTKGPPIVVFLGGAIVLMYGYQRLAQRSSRTGEPVLSTLSFLASNAIGALVFAGIVCGWLFALAQVVGWDALAREFRIEILDRANVASGRYKGVLFYPTNLLLGSLPWSIPAIVGLLLFFRGGRENCRKFARQPVLFQFFIFQCAVLIAALVPLTISYGKSARYIFPAFSAMANLCVIGIVLLRGEPVRWLYRIASAVGALLLLAAGALPFFLHLEGVPPRNVVLTSIAVGAAAAYLLLAARRVEPRRTIFALVLLLLAGRFGQAALYTPHRNAKMSVIPLARQIDSLVPAGEEIYTVQLFERWIVFYLERAGRDVQRLTPEIAARLVNEGREPWLLLTTEHEQWLVPHLAESEPLTLSGGRDRVVLLRTSPERLSRLTPSERFPTSAAPPEALLR